MATLVLTTVGTLVGGPVGGAIGALIGQQADRALFAPRPRQGPRLSELSVQTSSYGSALPKIFGTMRVAGTVIWSTDLREARTTSGGGKGAPKTVTYSYSASFAVALSGRRVASVGRIWADGKLLRGADGRFKSATGFRLYHGDEDQPVDPLIASVEGVGQAPAFRGLAYAVFEHLELEDFGNRIPSLTFELVAEPAPVAFGAIAQEISGGAVRGGETPAMIGFAASGDSVRAVLESVADVVPLSLVDEGEALRIGAATGEAQPVLAEDLVGRPERVRRAAAAVPDHVEIAYHDPARDYQTGLQRSGSGGSRRSDRRALAAVLTAPAAKAIAEERLAALRSGRERTRIDLLWRGCGLRPGSLLSLPDAAGRWRVERWTLGPMRVTLQLVRAPERTAAVAAAAPGRPVGHPDLVHGRTVLRLLDLPLAGKSPAPRVFAALAGTEPGWRRADLSFSWDGGRSWGSSASAAPAVMGSALTPPAACGPALFDERSRIEVQLLHEEMWLEGRDDAALLAGANLALIGGELVQFGRVEAHGGGRFTLSRLLRGRGASEWAIGLHEEGEPFTLIEESSLVALEPPAGRPAELQVMASGVGDDSPIVASLAPSFEAMAPPPPVHLRGTETGAGDLLVTWVRREREGWDGLSAVEDGVSGVRTAYHVVVSGAFGRRDLSVGEGGFVYTAAQRAADGATGPLLVEVERRANGRHSRAARLEIN